MAFLVFSKYIAWHYSTAPKDILAVMGNYLAGVWQKFAISQHTRTLFYPWRRQVFEYHEGSGLGAAIANKILSKIADLYLRLFSAVIRASIIITGLVIELAVVIGFLVFFLLWILWPFILISSLVKGVTLIIS